MSGHALPRLTRRWGPRTVASRAALAFAVVVLAAVGWLSVQGVAEAHAILVRSSPSAGAELSEGPSAIDLWFSEPLEERFSTFELLNAAGEALPVSGLRVDPADPYHLSGLLRLVGPGLYTVSYRNVSQSDGHEWSGSFSFTVLNPDGSVPAGTAYEPSLGASNSPANVLGRWLSFLGFALVSGGSVLLLPFARQREQTRGLWTLYAETYRRIAVAGVALLGAGGLLVILAQAEAIPGATVLDVVTGTRGGTLWAWRMLAVEVIAVFLALGFYAARSRRVRGEAVTLALLPVAAAAGLLTVSLLSHAAAAPGSVWAIATDYLHLLLATAWIGGIATLALLLFALRHGRSEDRAAAMVFLVVPFSVFAAVAVYVLAVTGVVRTFGEIPTLPALWETAYGRWLIAKLILVAGILGIAFLNRRAVRSVTRNAGRANVQSAAARVTRLLPYEVGVAALILLSVAVLGQSPTPRGGAVEAPAQAHAAFNGVEAGGDLSVHLQVSPAVVGENVLRIHVFGSGGSAPQDVDDVRVTFARAGALGGEQVEAAPEGDGVYTATGSFLSLALTWNITIDVTRPGQDDVRVAYTVPISPGVTGGTRSAPLASPAPQLPDLTFAALLLLMIGVGLALVGGRSRARVWSQTAGWVVVLVALWLGTSGGFGSSSGLTNPSPGDAGAIARGATLYEQHCATCHGIDGRGDGPGAVGLVPPPADLRTHIPLHPDSDTFLFITNGIAGTAMPAWEDTLSEEERWDLVNFLLDRYGNLSQ